MLRRSFVAFRPVWKFTVVLLHESGAAPAFLLYIFALRRTARMLSQKVYKSGRPHESCIFACVGGNND